MWLLLIMTWLGAASPLRPTRVDAPRITLDGQLNEAIYRNLKPWTQWYQLTPNEGEPPTRETRMWLFYDEEALYLSADLQEDPRELRVRTLERDSYTPDQDAVGLILDTFNDNLTAYGFIVTPAGVRTDIAIFNDAEGGGPTPPWNTNWNAFWDARTSYTENGWQVEIRIPFSSLRFESKKGRVTMGLMLWRYRAINLEYDLFRPTRNRWRYTAYKPSQMRDVIFEGIFPQNPIYIKPYALGGIARQYYLDERVHLYQPKDTWTRNVGLDVKYNLTSGLILDGTLNTDFAQVEVDDEQVNLTRFSLFFPEKRDFFQERADLFEYRLPGGPQRLFHSRRIGIVQGQQVPIAGGIRLTGRTGAWDVGFMEMQTRSSRLDTTTLTGENFGILRFKRQVFNPGSYIGGLFTSRTDFKGTYNLVAALDADIRVWEAYYINLKAAQTFEPGASPSDSRLAVIILHRRIRRGLGFGLSLTHLGPDFNPAMGFITRRGMNRHGNRVNYTWFPEAPHPIQSHTLMNRMQLIWNSRTGRLETHTNELSWEALFRSGSRFRIAGKYTYDVPDAPFTLGPLIVPPDAYRFLESSVAVSSPSGNPIQVEIKGTLGNYYGGIKRIVEFNPQWSVSPHLALQINYSFNEVIIHGQAWHVHLGRFRIRTALNRALSASAFIQYNSAEKQIGTNFRLRYNPREGTDFYLVYNNAVNTGLERSEPRLPLFQTHTLLIKYTYTFIQHL